MIFFITYETTLQTAICNHLAIIKKAIESPVLLIINVNKYITIQSL